MATFTELQTRVGQIVIDLPATVTAQLPTLVNEAIRELQRTHNFKVMEATTSTFTTTSATELLGACPSDFKQFRGKPIMINAQGDIERLEIAADQAEAWGYFGTSVGGEADTATLIGRPRVIYRTEPTNEAGATNFNVGPLPDQLSLYTNGNYRIRVPYWKYLATLSAGSSTNWFTVNADDFIVWQAAAEAFADDHDMEQSVLWAQKAQKKYAEIVLEDKLSRLSPAGNLIPQPDALRGPHSRGVRFGSRFTSGYR